MPKFDYSRQNVPGIPRAPVLRLNNASQTEFEKIKEKCALRLPILDIPDIIKYRQPHQALFQQLLAGGYHLVVEEILNLKELEETEVMSCGRSHAVIIKNTNLLGQIAQTLRDCADQERENKFFLSANSRFILGQDLMLSKDYWLAKHFLLTSLSVAQFSNSSLEVKQFQAKAHCLLAYIGQKNFENNTHSRELVEALIDHLEEARMLSKGKPWIFNCGNLMEIRIRKPCAIYGIREDSVRVNCRTQTMFNVATLIYFDILLDMITKTMETHPSLTNEDVDISLKLAAEALVLAEECKNQTAILSGLVRYGILLRDRGDNTEAMTCFQQLLHNAEFYHDFESQAIACGNISFCLQGRQFPIEALIWLEKQMEIAQTQKLMDMEADSVKRSGLILLQEGHSVEAEQAFYNVYNNFLETAKSTSNPDTSTGTNFQENTNLTANKKPKTILKNKNISQASTDSTQERPGQSPNPTHKKVGSLKSQNIEPPSEILDLTWCFTAIAAGTHLWGRVAGHCRLSNCEDAAGEEIAPVAQFKETRKQMHKVFVPKCEPKNIYDVFKDYDDKKIPNINSINKAPKRFRSLINTSAKPTDNGGEVEDRKSIGMLDKETGKPRGDSIKKKGWRALSCRLSAVCNYDFSKDTDRANLSHSCKNTSLENPNAAQRVLVSQFAKRESELEPRWVTDRRPSDDLRHRIKFGAEFQLMKNLINATSAFLGRPLQTQTRSVNFVGRKSVFGGPSRFVSRRSFSEDSQVQASIEAQIGGFNEIINRKKSTRNLLMSTTQKHLSKASFSFIPDVPANDKASHDEV